MRYFLWENAAMPLRAGGRVHSFDVVATIAGCTIGALALPDDQGDAFLSDAKRVGVEEIQLPEYEAQLAKKKRTRTPGGLRSNYDPYAEREQSRNRAADVAEEKSPSPEPPPRLDAAIKGSGNAVTIDDPIETGQGAAVELPTADELFGAGSLRLDIDSGKVRATDAAKQPAPTARKKK